jgi:hypothetical protein
MANNSTDVHGHRRLSRFEMFSFYFLPSWQKKFSQSEGKETMM